MIMDLVAFCEANSSLKFYPNAFPVSSETELGVVRLTPTGQTSKGGLLRVEFQILIRANHPSKAEQLTNEILSSIGDKKTGFNIGSTRVVLLEVKNPFPVYIGKDENERYKYSNDVLLLIEK